MMQALVCVGDKGLEEGHTHLTRRDRRTNTLGSNTFTQAEIHTHKLPFFLSLTHIQTDTQTDRHKDRHTHTDRHTDRQTHTDTHIQIDTYRQTHRQTDTHAHTHRDYLSLSHTQTDRHTRVRAHIHTHSPSPCPLAVPCVCTCSCVRQRLVVCSQRSRSARPPEPQSLLGLHDEDTSQGQC